MRRRPCTLRKCIRLAYEGTTVTPRYSIIGRARCADVPHRYHSLAARLRLPVIVIPEAGGPTPQLPESRVTALLASPASHKVDYRRHRSLLSLWRVSLGTFVGLRSWFVEGFMWGTNITYMHSDLYVHKGGLTLQTMSTSENTHFCYIHYKISWEGIECKMRCDWWQPHSCRALTIIF